MIRWKTVRGRIRASQISQSQSMAHGMKQGIQKSGLYDLSCLRTFLITGDKSAAQNTLDAGDALEETKTDLNNVPPEWLVNITEILLEVGQEFVLQLEANDTGELTYGIEGTITDLEFNFSTTTQTTTSSETTTTPGTTTTPIATTTQDTTTTPETTTSSIATTTQETTTTPESTTITQTSTTTPQPGTNPEPTTSQGPTVPSESTSISQTVSTKSASTTESAAETQTTTTTLAPTTTPPRTDVTQMNFSMTLNQTCDQEVTNAGSQAYLQALAIFRQVVLALGNYTQVPVFGIAEMSFRCGSIIGSGVLQLPRNVTDNSTQVAEKFSNAIASGEVPEVRTQSVQGLNVSDVNECSNGRNNCDESADCTDTDPGFTCQCLSGFRDLVPSDPGTSCEDQCFLSGADYCTNGATCVRQQGSQNPTCQCTDFYQGARCADRNGGAIAGLTIGLLALAALIVAAVAIVIHLRRKRKSHNFAAADVPAEARTRYDDVSTGSTRGRLDDVLQ